MSKEEFLSEMERLYDIYAKRQAIRNRQAIINEMEDLHRTGFIKEFTRLSFAIVRGDVSVDEGLPRLREMVKDSETAQSITRSLPEKMPVTPSETKEAKAERHAESIRKAQAEKAVRDREKRRETLFLRIQRALEREPGPRRDERIIYLQNLYASEFGENPLLVSQETREQAIVNTQKRSNGGVIRLESGDGK